MYQYILFDLDGTLIDSEEGITKSVAYTLAKFGITEDPKNLKHFIGPPLFRSFSLFYGFDAETSAKAVEYYREYFGEKGVYMNTVYDGVEKLLKSLCAAGKTLVLATSKYEYYAKMILEDIGFSQYFAFAAGSLKDGGRGTKAEVISYILSEMQITDRSSVLMIGDRMHDVEGAAAVGVDSVGVLWGFGDENELSSHGATYIAKNTEDVLKIITQ